MIETEVRPELTVVLKVVRKDLDDMCASCEDTHTIKHCKKIVRTCACCVDQPTQLLISKKCINQEKRVDRYKDKLKISESSLLKVHEEVNKCHALLKELQMDKSKKQIV